MGSINHTLLSLFAAEQYGIPVKAIVYNQYPHIDSLIEANTLEYLRIKFPQIPLLLLNDLQQENPIDISPLL